MRIVVNNITLGYDDHGVGLPVLFLHAFPLNRSMWDGEMMGLLREGRYRLVSLDWRGFGESDIAIGNSTMEMLADDVARLMDALGMQDAVLCGLSMGGYAAFAFLRKYPQRVRGLILADTKPGADTAEGRQNREQVAQLAEKEGVEAIADLMLPKLLTEDTRREHPEVELRIRQMINAATPQGIAAASRGMALRVDSTNVLGNITCPTLVVVGDEDILIPPAIVKEYAAVIQNAQMSVMLHAAHLSNVEQPEAFLQVIHSFLQTIV